MFWQGFLLGSVVGAISAITAVWYANTNRCKHKYKNWESWGVTYQRGKCEHCGKMKLESL